MLMTGPLFGRALLVVPACGPGLITIAAAMPTVPSMPAVAKHMHRDHPDGEQHPNPVR